MVGKVLSHYHIMEEIGRGGMGAVTSFPRLAWERVNYSHQTGKGAKGECEMLSPFFYLAATENKNQIHDCAIQIFIALVKLFL